jgi:SSS family transporter
VRPLDWLVLAGTLGAIIAFGVWRTRGIGKVGVYLRSGDKLSWPTIGLAVMATQASAITFLSVPGLAFEEGMGFVQFYFGLPLALVVVAAVFVPIFYRLRVYTAYEYLEQRFDVRVRLLGAVLFLVQRGLAAGITIFAPAIILSTVFGLPLTVTNLFIGVSVIVYTVAGGNAAVSQTQKHQMLLILLGMAAAAWFLVSELPADMSLDDAAALAGTTGRMKIVDTDLRWDTRYNLWSGLTGGFFLALSYFGTDQSQVGRYLGGKSTAQGKLGLLFNAVFKIPMQFSILFIGILLYVFYVFAPAPAYFDPAALERARRAAPAAVAGAERAYEERLAARRDAATAWLDERRAAGDPDPAARRFADADRSVKEARSEVKRVVAQANVGAARQDADFVFISFVVARMPAGLVGLLVAVILAAAMSSISAELSALGTTCAVDLYQRLWRRRATEPEMLRATKLLTIGWGLVALGFALVADLFDNLVEAVNVLGSLFYGTILGLFLVAFFFRHVRAGAVFGAALLAQASVLAAFAATDLGFLWFNVVGAGIVVGGSLLLQATRHPTSPPSR